MHITRVEMCEQDSRVSFSFNFIFSFQTVHSKCEMKQGGFLNV